MNVILLVEDDAWLASCYKSWLEPAGWAVHHAADAQTALDALDHVRPDVILLDLMLPVANGLQVLHQLASYADTADIPVVLCSSALPDPLPDLTPYGVRAALDKTTLSPKMLRTVVKQVLHHAVV